MQKNFGRSRFEIEFNVLKKIDRNFSSCFVDLKISPKKSEAKFI